MYNDLNGKNVLVTGGTKGIGKAISLGFAGEGANVMSISRNIPEDADDRITYYNCDVSNSNNVKSTIETILSKFNSIDILVNNAGLEEYARLDKTDESMWDKVMDINVKGVYNVSKYCIPDMIKNHGGNIINISSVQANIITKNAAAYVTSKHAIIGLTKSIALDYAPQIRCNAVLPATIDTPLVRKAAILEVGNNEEKIKEKIKEWGL
ncbi:SDR family NAD(P)-dependent oxidoreductase, partial [Ferroplasma sp.]|uniref:SDR family NAD(P)-dependent oxidoreductase n=1 Tax=Ferroplasma sp. TaxID=2591003 RepID=UPI00261E5E5E